MHITVAPMVMLFHPWHLETDEGMALARSFGDGAYVVTRMDQPAIPLEAWLEHGDDWRPH